MQFQERDGQILLMIYSFDGMLALRQLKLVFWPQATLRAAQKRLAMLVEYGYLERPTRHQWRTEPIPEPIFWLGWKGILWIAGQSGIDIELPENLNENWLRKLDRRLRGQGIRWLREPRWIQLAHDLAVADFRLAIESAIGELPSCHLETWIHESEFRSDGDAVDYRLRGRDGTVKKLTKLVYPDSFFVIVDEQRSARGLLARARFLLEMDNATHPNDRFGREKVAPGLAYINSPQYKARFGSHSGCWVVVTTGERRMNNLMRQTAEIAGAGARAFYFTTLGQLRASDNVLTNRLWRQPGGIEPIALLVGD